MGCFTQIMSALRDSISRLKQDKPLCIKVVVVLAAIVLLLLVIIIVASVVSSDSDNGDDGQPADSDGFSSADEITSTTTVATTPEPPEDTVDGYFVIKVGLEDFKQDLTIHQSLPVQISKFEADGYDVFVFQKFSEETQLIAGIQREAAGDRTATILFCSPESLDGSLVTIEKLQESSGPKNLNVNGRSINFTVTFTEESLKIPEKLLGLLTDSCSSLPTEYFLQTQPFKESLTCGSNETGSWTCQNATCLSDSDCQAPTSVKEVCMKYRVCARCNVLEEEKGSDDQGLPDCKCRKRYVRDRNDFPCLSQSIDPNCQELTKKQKEEFTEAFNLFDKDGDGLISIEELTSVLRSLGYNATRREVREIVIDADLNGDKKIDLPEFMELVQRQKKDSDADEELMKAFRLFDKGDRGYIGARELKRVMRQFGEELSEEGAEGIIRAVDFDGDGLINFEEFKAAMSS